ncbi:MAG TPA: VOC family protein [Gaiellaceae bacterium]|jgi:catechol 2,3-dioxygenase-like lactoylglutathione lyase family enzyme|nr:VOC family protein [Gaiellaceae bacterium]
MTVPVTGINEIVLEVLDLEKAVAFYGDALGLPLYSRSDDRAWFVAGRSRIGLWRPQIGLAQGRGGVHVHYAFNVLEDDFGSIVDRLRALDPEVISFEDEGRGRAVYVTDPDGNVVEFWTWDVARDAVVA